MENDMKKILCIVLLLFGCVGTNIFGYDWTVVNDTSEYLDIEVCNTSSCQDSRIGPRQSHTFSFGGIQSGLLLGSVTVNQQALSAAELQSKLHTIIGFGGTFSITGGNSSSGYTFSG